METKKKKKEIEKWNKEETHSVRDTQVTQDWIWLRISHVRRCTAKMLHIFASRARARSLRVRPRVASGLIGSIDAIWTMTAVAAAAEL